MSSSAQKEKVKQFVAVTGINEKKATQMLEKHKWNLDVAMDAFYMESPGHAPQIQSQANEDAIKALFDKYKDFDSDTIGVDGTEALCADLGIDTSDVVTLALSWHLKCERMCEFTRNGWVAGWTDLGCDSLEKMIESLAKMRKELKEDSTFKDIYRFVFNFSKQPGQKSLDSETACALWQLLFADRAAPYLEDWVSFITEQHKRPIIKDTWNLFLDFTKATANGLDDYEMDGAWPVVFDEFVRHLKAKKN